MSEVPLYPYGHAFAPRLGAPCKLTLWESFDVKPAAGKLDTRLPVNGHYNFHGARPVRQIISMIKWTRTSRLSIDSSLSQPQTLNTRRRQSGTLP